MVPFTIGPQAHSWRSEGLTDPEWTESPTPTEAGTRRDVYIRSERSDHKRKLVSSAHLWVRSHLNSEPSSCDRITQDRCWYQMWTSRCWALVSFESVPKTKFVVLWGSEVKHQKLNQHVHKNVDLFPQHDSFSPRVQTEAPWIISSFAVTLKMLHSFLVWRLSAEVMWIIFFTFWTACRFLW